MIIIPEAFWSGTGDLAIIQKYSGNTAIYLNDLFYGEKVVFLHWTKKMQTLIMNNFGKPTIL